MRSNSFIAQQLATESIGFQSLDFFNELCLVWGELKKVPKDKISEHELSYTATAVVKKYTGLDITFDINQQQPSVDIPAIDKNNVLVNSTIREWVSSSDGLRMINNAEGMMRGSVDLIKGRVGGIFTEVKHTIHMPVRMYAEEKFSPEEITAITLHEVGHLMTFYEFMSRSVTTNQVLAGVSKALDESDSVEKREHVFLSVKKALKLKELDAKELATVKDAKVAEVVILASAARQVESELGSNIYDFTTWEYLSDQYAARNGAGRYLVTALDKLYGGNWNISFRSLPMYLAFEAIKILLLVTAFHSVFGATLINVLFIMIAMDSNDDSYDKPEARFRRVRSQIVENLKDKALSKADVQRLQDDLGAIDQILKGVEDRRQFITAVWTTIWPSARRNWNQEKLQKELEALAINDLFIKAAELRTLK